MAFLRAILAVFALTVATAVSAEQPAQSRIVAIIQSQLDAFAADDPARAYSFAAPVIQDKFGNPEAFMQMVSGGYGALIAPVSVAFETYERSDDRAIQSVRIAARDGSVWVAHYLMQRMDDGTWRIAGCQMERAPGGTI